MLPGLFCFHHSKPLATFRALTGSGNDYNKPHHREPLIAAINGSFAVVNLIESTSVNIKIPDAQREFAPRLQISDCGSFTYMSGRHEMTDVKTRLMVS